MDELLLLRVNSLLKHIEEIENDIKNLSYEQLKKSNITLRAVCFSLSQIGELMNQLEEKISTDYPNLPWKAARKMRNVIVHDYFHADFDQIYFTITKDLQILKESFVKIKNNLEFTK